MTAVYKILSSTPYPLGVRREGRVIFASMVSESENCGILLFSNHTDVKSPLKIPFPAEYRVGKVYSMRIEGVLGDYTRYLLYKGEEIVPDTYGRCFVRREYGKPADDTELFGILGSKTFDWQKDIKPDIAFSDAIFYGLHVRGFTKDTSSKCRYKGTFKGIIEKLDYLYGLGITSLVLMPAYEFIENELPVTDKDMKRRLIPVTRTVNQSLNYWGYKKGFYYAPKAAYAAGNDACLEMKQLVKACHEKGMELFMQFYFPEDVPEPEILGILEYWVQEYHIDGFQILAEHININLIKYSPILSDTKIIFREFEDVDSTGLQNSCLHTVSGETSFKQGKKLCIYKEDTQRDYRLFIKGEEHTLEAVMHHVRKNGRNIAYMNSIADYQGFRLADLVSYDYKHNEANGEHNLDGSNYNYSWNCGEEGTTANKKILKLRNRQMKNALSLIFLSQGTPYLFMGDEMGQSQQGNNNPYNQDNEISWLNWKNLQANKEIFKFTRELIAYRKLHPVLHKDEIMNGTDILGCGYPDLSFHGLEVFRPLSEPYRKELGIMLCGKYARTCDGEADKMIYIACNMHSVQHTFMLPKLEKGLVWKIAMQTADEPLLVKAEGKEKVPSSNTAQSNQTVHAQQQITVPPRSIVVLEACKFRL